MSSRVQKIYSEGKIHPPRWLPTNVHYECIMGSVAYGVSSDTSDMDIYGFCIPKIDDIFPHLTGEIPGFGTQKQRFNQWQQHHIMGNDGKEYDFSVYSIVKFFHLCMSGNPNMVDSLFVPQNCVIHATNIGQLVRENRRMFLHKGCWHKLKGYAYSQLNKIRTKNADPNGKRAKMIEEFGYDVKFAYHVYRLLDEAQQILETGDLDLQRANEAMKSIRRGEWTVEQIEQHFSDKERQLEELYHKSELPYGPDEDAIKALLVRCLEMHYGSLDNIVVMPDQTEKALLEIRGIVDRVLPQ